MIDKHILREQMPYHTEIDGRDVWIDIAGAQIVGTPPATFGSRFGFTLRLATGRIVNMFIGRGHALTFENVSDPPRKD